jgi:natural product biosynthesis luciferase-like monooxygenase protein
MPEATTLVEAVRRWARERPEREACRFTAGGDGPVATYAQLDQGARAVAASLQRLGLAGKRVLLLYPPALDYLTAFLGCLYAGAVAVPAYPPQPGRPADRLDAIIDDAQPAAVLTTAASLGSARAALLAGPAAATLAATRWVATDTVEPAAATGWREPELDADLPAFLQYTSGSTATPRGVMVSHANVVHNERMIQRAFAMDEHDVVVGWLPVYHDMGLIGILLQPLLIGARVVLLAPLEFLKRPRCWLEAISTHRGTVSGGPNFGYELCLRKIPPGQREGLDLAGWRVAFNGAEPVSADTLDRFAEAFAGCGFRRDAFYPCYGLAEATLFVTGGLPGTPPRVTSVSGAALEAGRVEAATPGSHGARRLVGCGEAWLGGRVLVVDPERRVPCPADRIGEIWVAGPHVASGYWGRPDPDNEVFGARLSAEDGSFLRTGDLGFLHDGGLFVTGRRKDLIIVRGRNHYPQDIELTVARTHPALRPNGGAAFGLEIAGEERLAIVQELDRAALADPPIREITTAIRDAVLREHELEVADLVLAKPGQVPKTSSGKVQRRECRRRLLAGRLAVVHRAPGDGMAARSVAGEVERQASLRPLATAAAGADGQVLTYGELNRRANRLAHRLREAGAGPGTLVELRVQPAAETLLALLSILKAGAGAVIVDHGTRPVDLPRTTLPPLVPSRRLEGDRSSSDVLHADELASVPGPEADLPAVTPTGPACVLPSRPGEAAALTEADLAGYFGRLDRRVGCRPAETLLTAADAFDALAVLEALWVLTRGGRVVLASSGPDPVARSERTMQFSLFYFAAAADAADDPYLLYLTGAQFADRHGFAAVWTPERHFHAFGGLFPNPSVPSAALAVLTQRVRLRAGSVVLPLHHPVRVAEEWAVVDCLSGGRVDLAFARGWNVNDFVLAPGSYAGATEILFEHMETVRRLWRGEPIRLPNGSGQETEIRIHPAPRQPDLNVWVVCSGGPQRFAEAGASGANILTALLFQTPDELAEKLALYRRARAEHGHEPDGGHVTLMLHTFLGDDVETVRRQVRGPFIEYLKTSVDLWRQGAERLEELNERERQVLLDYAFERYFRTAALFGTPETCLPMVDRLRQAGVDELACLIDFGVAVEPALAGLHHLNRLRELCGPAGRGGAGGTAGAFWRALERDEVALAHCPPGLPSHLIAGPAAPGTARVLLAAGDGAAAPGGPVVLSRSERRRLLTPAGEDAGRQVEPAPPEPVVAAPAHDARPLVRWLMEAMRQRIAVTLEVEPARVSLHDSFSHLGIDSLKAVELMAALSDELGVTLAPTVLFEHPSVAKLAAHLVAEHHPAVAGAARAATRGDGP